MCVCACPCVPMWWLKGSLNTLHLITLKQCFSLNKKLTI